MITSEELQRSVVLVTDGESNSKRFGTGFVIRQVCGYTYVLTCAHVINSFANPEKIEADGMRAKLLVSGEDNGLDLAVLKVSGLISKSELKLKAVGKSEHEFLTAGFQLFDNTHLIRPIEGVLGESVGLQSTRLRERIQAWDLHLTDDFLQPGHSGSPIVDQSTGNVLGVVSYRQGEGKRGIAISIEAVKNIWKFIDSNQLYRSLLKLGYSKQVRLFRTLVKKYSIAALLIYGPPEHGQRWLLNLLLSKHLPYILTSRVIRVALNCRGRRFDAKGLWRELSRHLLLPPTATTEEIIKEVYACWKTQNIILIFHQINWLPQASIQELIQSFWLPLAKDIRLFQQQSQTTNKLLMFLVDYEGNVGSLEDFFTSQTDSSGQVYEPIKVPEISQFSEDELLNWLEKEGDELPGELVDELDETVESILDASEDGVPELTLEEICSRCGFNWYEESEKWLKY